MKSARGQLILVAALVVALAILGSVVLLNTLHVPADINTQQDARSLEAVEGTTSQVTHDLERLFWTHTSVADVGEPVPYANESTSGDKFGANVTEYSNITANLTASDASALVSVEYLDSTQGSEEGLLARQNDSSKNLTSQSTDWDVLESADTMPYLYLSVTGSNESDRGIEDGETFVVELGGDSVQFDQTSVNYPGDSISASTHDDLYPVEIEVIDGMGEVRTGEVIGNFEVNSGLSDVTFRNGNKTTGSYTISGTGSADSDLTNGANGTYQYTRSGVVVNPRFRVTFTDASVSHTTTFKLYNSTGP